MTCPLPDEARNCDGVHTFDVNAEVDRLFDDSSLCRDGDPLAVLIADGVAAGKTTIRKQKYSSGDVLIDAADIFLSLSRGEFFPFSETFEEPINCIGRLVTKRALSERRDIVTEIIGAEVEPTKRLFRALESIAQFVAITCEREEAMQRNLSPRRRQHFSLLR